jgi:FkbH-like protein
MVEIVADIVFRCPEDLKISGTPLRRVVAIGSCLMAGWPAVLKDSEGGCPCDFLLVNNVPQLPEAPSLPVSEYDFQVIQIPLRFLIPDGSYFQLSYMDREAYELLFENAVERLSQFIQNAMRWNTTHGLLTFVCNFLVPQQNPMGRLLPRYDLRNLVYFVERLNVALDEKVRQFTNAHVFDLDQLVSTYGRKYFQDDVTLQINHGAALTDSDFEYDQDRIEPATRASETYPTKTHDYIRYAWTELLSLYRTLRQIDIVKLVIVDLDDTLWRGVAAESGALRPEAVEGWPLGLVEALGHLKRRGTLLALVSKNEESRIVPIWNDYFGARLSLDQFALRKINWRPKAENFAEILQTVNLLPKNVVFIDDNPVEREAIKLAFPGVRVFGSNPLLWRRILLWSAETQVPSVTAEASARTAMVQAQVEREAFRAQVSHSDFLASLGVQVRLFEIRDPGHPGFPRMLELINKTNQFNTTGIRWTRQECQVAFSKATSFYAFEVTDRFTSYGLVGVVVVEGSHLGQFVMSCRVVGMELELAVVAAILEDLRDREFFGAATASFVDTDTNLLCRDLYERCGFVEVTKGYWHQQLNSALPLVKPVHIDFQHRDLDPARLVEAVS